MEVFRDSQVLRQKMHVPCGVVKAPWLHRRPCCSFAGLLLTVTTHLNYGGYVETCDLCLYCWCSIAFSNIHICVHLCTSRASANPISDLVVTRVRSLSARSHGALKYNC